MDEYRRSFHAASEFVVGVLRTEFLLSPTARPAKSTAAIAEKLVRQRTRLTQIQDIAGCRVIVPTMNAQMRVVAGLEERFSGAQLFDRVTRPNHGYRAIHAVVKYEERPFEIQIRTESQHLWAALSEKVADRFGHELKYGEGRMEIQAKLLKLADLAHNVDWQLDLALLLEAGVEQSDSAELKETYRKVRRALDDDRRTLSHRFQLISDNPDELLDAE